MKLLSVACAHPAHRYEQSDLIAAFAEHWGRTHHNASRVEQLHRAVQVGSRYLALPMDAYKGLTFRRANDAFIEVGTAIAESAVRGALAEAGLEPHDVDALYFTTVTGIATPSIDARLVNRLGLRTDVRRVPMFGLGCVAGAAGLSRLDDYLRGRPDDVAVLVSVELCSLTLQQQDVTIPNLIASGLFGDGAAAVVASGTRGTGGPRIVATRSRFYPDTERVMGWDVGETGFRIVLSPDVPELVLRHMADDVDGFLGAEGLCRRDIGSWVCHPGGPKVLHAFERALGLTRHDVELTWRSLHEVGNLSSASVLFVLRDTMRDRPPPAGTPGLVLAMGPGFCAEMVLVRW